MTGTLQDDGKLERIAVDGQVSGLDLSGKSFSSCEFKNLEFYNCNFDANTTFLNCRFVGNLTFTNCSKANYSKLEECKCSDAALISWDEIQGKTPKGLITEEHARNALRDILRKFEQRFGFGSIKYIDHDTGPISKSPCKEKAWSALSSAGIIQKHRISGVSEGGLHIPDDSEVKHEVRNFLDNAAIGKRLKRALDQILS